jgi:outer membrane protein assembly factor BamB
MSVGESDTVKTAGGGGRILNMMTNYRFLCKVFIAGIAGCAVCGAEPWRVWRGDPEMTGVAKESLAFPLKPAWKFEAAKPVKATAVSDGERFFIGDAKGKFRALAAADGKPAWEFDAKHPIEGSALLVGSHVIFGSLGGTVHCLDAKTGTETWKFETEGEVHAAPNVFDRPGQPPLILIGSYDNRLYALNSKDGSKVWTVETGNYVNGSAAVVEGMTAFGGCDGYVYFVNAADGSEAGKVEVRNPIANTVASRNGLAVLAHYGHEVIALDAKKFEPKWVYNEREFEYFASPAVTADGLVLAGDRGKRLLCLASADGSEKWAFRATGRIDSSPVVTGANAVFGSDDGNVYAVSLASGDQVWKYEIGEPVQSSPCISGGRLVIAADDGVVYCFGGAR